MRCCSSSATCANPPRTGKPPPPPRPRSARAPTASPDRRDGPGRIPVPGRRRHRWLARLLAPALLLPAAARGFDPSPPEFEAGRLVYDDFNQIEPEAEARIRQRLEAFARDTGLRVALVIDDAIVENIAASSTSRLISSVSRDPAHWPANFNEISARAIAYGDAFDHWLLSQPGVSPAGPPPRILFIAEGSSQRIDFSARLGDPTRTALASRAAVPPGILVPSEATNRADLRSVRLSEGLLQLLDLLQPPATDLTDSSPRDLLLQLRLAARAWPLWVGAILLPLAIWLLLRLLTRNWHRSEPKSRRRVGLPVIDPAYRLGGATSGGFGVSVRIRTLSEGSRG